jgi:hypothetical protein
MDQIPSATARPDHAHASAPSRFARLPEPIRIDQTIASSESGPHPDEKDDYWREVEWLLRVTGGF